MKNRKLLILSVLFSLLFHMLLAVFLNYMFERKLHNLPKLPKQYFVDIVTLPKQKKSIKQKVQKKEKHKIAANISRQGMAKKFSKQEKIPIKTVKPKELPKQPKPQIKYIKPIPLEKPKKNESLGVSKKKQSKRQPNKGLHKGRKKLKKQPKTIKITGNLFNTNAILSNKNRKGSVSGTSKEYKYKHAEREATVTLGTQSLKYSSYMEHVKNKIQNVWVYPEDARMNGEQGQLLILFSIEKDGDVKRIKLLRSSGFSSLDSAAIQAIKDASPFPPLPKRFNIDRFNIYATFSYKLGFYYVE